MDDKKWTDFEESYAYDFCLKLKDPKRMAGMLGGVPPWTRTGNRVFFDYQSIETMMIFSKFDGRLMKLGLQMWVIKDKKKKTGPLEFFPCLDEVGKDGGISDDLFEQIINEFYLLSFKPFYDLHNLKQ